jgi:hypothetical protein
MSTPVTLPGTIPGLVRVGAFVLLDHGAHGIVTQLHHTLSAPRQLWSVVVADSIAGLVRRTDPKTIALDLSDPTSRVDAAWWVCGQGGGITEDEHVILIAAKNGLTMGEKAQRQLRDMVLHRVKA